MLTNLIIVAGHSVYIGKNFDDVFNDKNWFLFPFQKGEPNLYIEHIMVGCELAEKDKNSFLIFTGGQSRKEAWFRSESQTYWEVAEHLGYLNDELKYRTTTEEFSRDSFENLLFPICRFREYLGYYPKHITLVTFSFKEKRFHLHREAIRMSNEMVTFVGVNNPEDFRLTELGEDKAIEQMKDDPNCCHGGLLDKRNLRNISKRQNGYTISCPELKELLEYKRRELFKGKLPWD